MSFDFIGTPGGLGLLLDRAADEPASPVEVEEKLTHPERRTVDFPDIPFFGTDGLDSMGLDLARSVVQKGFRLHIIISERWSAKVSTAYGQVGFVRRRGDQEGSAATTAQSFTSRHNIVVEDKYKLIAALVNFRCEEYELNFPADQKAMTDQVPYPLRRKSEPSLRNDQWVAGIDITAGSVPSFIISNHSFEIVREDFVLKVGQKIGMVVAMPPHDTLKSSLLKMYSKLNAETLEGIYGIQTERLANVYTGQITYVGDSHIEYDINTFTGCSGAVVFLLDKHQPESVNESDYGCAIAVHAGAHPFYNRNLAFIIPRLL